MLKMDWTFMTMFDIIKFNHYERKQDNAKL